LRRKQMQRVLRTARGLPADSVAELLARAEIDPTARPEVLSPEKFATLFGLL
jgi:16S rRNA A1518/A1519 N6-dimethyltransferase RsmA/KsgA/DIM1 with predicted DNA glycosylase/AP lyase activity